VAKAKVIKPKSATRTKAPPAAATPPKRAAATKAAPAKAAKPAKPTKVSKVAKVTAGAKRAAKNPAAAEVVAATLVAAAAALRNPKKAQALALEAADDIKRAAKSGINSGEAMWKLAMDVARRSIDALGPDSGKGKKAKAKKPAGKKKK
jgi:hypothetical protein